MLQNILRGSAGEYPMGLGQTLFFSWKRPDFIVEDKTGEERASSFIYQKVSVAVQV